TALNPVRRVGSLLMELARARGLTGPAATAALESALGALDLDFHDVARRYPHQLSGGMQQRVLNALAMVGEPALVIADEPTSGLDPDLVEATAAGLSKLAERGAGLLVITHDLRLARRLGGRLALLYGSHLVESRPTERFFDAPAHPYGRGLLAAMPEHGGVPIPGQPPELTALPEGCPFQPRCPVRIDACDGPMPEPVPVAGDAPAPGWVRCYRHHRGGGDAERRAGDCPVRPGAPADHRGRRGEPGVGAGPAVGADRPQRLRQVHLGPGTGAATGPGRGAGPPGRAGGHRCRAGRTTAASAAGAAGVAVAAGGGGPTAAAGPGGTRAADRPRRAAGGPQSTAGGGDRGGRAHPGAAHPLPARGLRRTTAARGARPGTGAAAPVPDLRRAHRDAGRLDPGITAGGARRPPAGRRRRHPADHARPGARRPLVRRGTRHPRPLAEGSARSGAGVGEVEVGPPFPP